MRSLVKAVKSDLSMLCSEALRIYGLAWRSRKIHKYLDCQKEKKLHLGAGSNVLDGWLNTDIMPQSREIIYLDITEPLPFADGTFSCIFSEHLIEHISYESAVTHLQECYRVLCSGGRIRISTPNLEFLINLYTSSQKTGAQQKYMEWTVKNCFPGAGVYNEAFVVNNFLRSWDHKFIYNTVTLENIVRQAAFGNIKWWPVGQSDDSRLQNIEKHGTLVGEDFNLLQTMCLEAIKI